LNERRQAGKTVSLDLPAEPGVSAAPDLADPQPLPDEQIARWEGIGLVRLSLETLDDSSRELIRLKFNEELSYKEISAQTGLSVGHVGYLLHHALKEVGDELARNGVTK
jgi:RNA polymerase sigma-70 factor (ECF subfamily)